MKYIVFDLEATCDNDDKDFNMGTIEIGAVKVDDKLNIVGEFSAFVRPILNPTTFEVEIIEGFIPPGEHRDMWDKYMVIKYPELKINYDDDHKALPRGRVDYSIKNNKLSFFITLDKCIKGQERNIRSMYNLTSGYIVDFHYGTLNYKCKNCR